MINLYRVANDQLIGPISAADRQVLIDVLEEESAQDRDYYIDAATIDLLRLALGTTDGLDIRWVERA